MTILGTLLALFFTSLLMNFLFFGIWRAEKERTEDAQAYHMAKKLELEKRLNEAVKKINYLERGIEPSAFKYRTPRPLKRIGGKAE